MARHMHYGAVTSTVDINDGKEGAKIDTMTAACKATTNLRRNFSEPANAQRPKTKSFDGRRTRSGTHRRRSSTHTRAMEQSVFSLGLGSYALIIDDNKGTRGAENTPVADTLDDCTAVPQLIMWGYLAWYVVVSFAVHPPTMMPYTSAIMIMVLLGIVLNANAFVAFKQQVLACPAFAQLGIDTLSDFVTEHSLSIFRLFLIPYCVSSYAAIAGARSDVFFTILPTERRVWIPALVASLGLPLMLALSARVARKMRI